MSSLNNKRSGKPGIIILLLALFIAVEFVFDIVELAVGGYMLLINPIRPRIGRLWEESRKDDLGANHVDLLVDGKTPVDSPSSRFYSMEELSASLSSGNLVSISRADFLTFYRMLPPSQAKNLFDPAQIYELSRSPHWQGVRFSMDAQQLAVYCLDGHGQLLVDHYVELIDDVTDTRAPSGLSQELSFAGRVISAEIFLNAYDRLSNVYRLQIINDPYKLVQWGENLKRVGLSQFVSNNAVELAFEIASVDRPIIQRSLASEIAVNYLIIELNKAGFILTPPKRDGDANE